MNTELENSNYISTNTRYVPTNTRLVLMVIVLGMAYFFTHFHRLALAVIAGAIMEDLNISITQLGMLGSAYFYSYAIMQIPSGMLADKYGTKKVVTISLIITAFGSLILGFVSSFSSALISRVLIGIGVSCVYIAALKSLREWFDDAKFGFLTGLMFSLGNIGALTASTPLSMISEKFGWRWAFISIGTFTTIMAVFAWVIILGNKKTGNEDVKRDKSEDKRKVKKIVTSMGFFSLVLWFIIFAGSKLSFQSLWAAPYFKEVFGFTDLQISKVLMVFTLGNVFGGPIVGYLSDKLGTKNVFVTVSAIFGSSWLLVAYYTSISYTFSLIFYFLMGIAGAGALAVGFSSVRNLGPKSISGSLLGFINCAAFLGTGIITQLTGEIVKNLKLSYDLFTVYKFIYIGYFICAIIVTLMIALTFSREKKELTA